jgi:gamma-glutamyl phosphate reductase
MWSGDMKDIFIIVFATLSVCFAVSYLLVLRQSVKLKRDVSKLFIEKTLLQEYVDLNKSTKTKEESDDSIHKENFIKFLSDSRDWAFSYIESVQKVLTKFVNDVDADISYFNEYGEALSMSRPDYPSMKNISIAYKELKTLLPEDEIKQ